MVVICLTYANMPNVPLQLGPWSPVEKSEAEADRGRGSSTRAHG